MIAYNPGVNEFELIARFFSWPPRAASVHLAGGDDAALLAPAPGFELAASVDMLVGGRHFFADADPERLGHKALAVNLSDMAAMGATPRWALLAGALPDVDPAWLGAFARGFYALADAHGVDLVGGDTTRGPLNLCVTIMGEVPQGQALLRSGARPGDDVYVSGALGDAALAVAAMTGRARLDAGRWPRPRAPRKAGAAHRARASRCAASRPLRSTCPTAWPATSRTSSSARPSARRSIWRPFRARRRWRSLPAATTARSRSSACWPVATTTSCASPRRARRRIA